MMSSRVLIVSVPSITDLFIHPVLIVIVTNNNYIFININSNERDNSIMPTSKYWA